MFSIIRSVSVHTKPTGSLIFTASHNVAGNIPPVIGNVKSHQSSYSSGSPTSMDKIKHTQEPTEKGDVMSRSFEDEYTTRSDEEGFGGCFSGNNSLSGREQEKLVYANSPEYDKKTQDGDEPKREKDKSD
ncbi:hypothetical protein E3N88_29989 [Mikania micrantha]|uniref:Uncharacterized protein n=1 Tax=Mikania micrantha TaxID=192012 RepID=A0A5N6ML07_9ASTR|nr:hypothetical protein E3N88_29989 [Mikania micrantha]